MVAKNIVSDDQQPATVWIASFVNVQVAQFYEGADGFVSAVERLLLPATARHASGRVRGRCGVRIVHVGGAEPKGHHDDQ